ncbi:CapA family protein [Candidatus Saccharibacteria bacterium]|nr:CapA family protein [Candidatus Saccharibacteria bacterium]
MKKKIAVGFLCFLLAGGLGFFGVQFVTKTGIFKVPGVVRFSESFPDSEAEKIAALFEPEEIELDKDLVFYYTEMLDETLAAENSYLADIFVPTAEFYSTETSLTAEEFQSRYEAGDSSVVSIKDLDSGMKLLAVGEHYFLETFDSGAIFKYLRIDGETEEDLALARNLILPTLDEFPTKDTTLSLAQTGVTALSRGINTRMNAVGTGTYFTENIGEFLSSFDLTHTSNESSFTDYATSANICSDWRFVDTLTAIGLDIVELTGNHNQDCGDQAALDTLDKYDELGIKTVGGGRTATEAAEPLRITDKAAGVTMLAYNQSTGGATLDDSPGANQYYPAQAAEDIAAAKARGDVVIVDMQYYECNEYASSYEDTTCDYAYSSAGDQVGVFRSLIDNGADVVIGTAAHQTQTYEKYGNGEIYYGLGNLFFDQSWWPGTTRSLGLVHYIWNGKLLQTRKFGTVYDNTYQTRLMNAEELARFINRLNEARDI